MHPRHFALVGGIVMLILGVVSLIPSLVGPIEGLPPMVINASYGLFLGLFPLNILNKIVMILFGIGGILAANAKYTSLPSSIHFSRLVFYVMGALAIFGIIPQTDTFYGYYPIFGGDIILHGLFAIVGAYFGFVLTSKVPDSGPAVRNFTTPVNSPR